MAFVPVKANWLMHQLMLGEYIRNYLALFRDPKQNKWLALILILQKILLSEHRWKLALCTAFSRSIMGRQKGLPSGSLMHMWGSQLPRRLCQDRTGWSCGRDSGNRAQEMPREKAGFLRKVTGGKLHQVLGHKDFNRKKKGRKGQSWKRKGLLKSHMTEKSQSHPQAVPWVPQRYSCPAN